VASLATDVATLAAPDVTAVASEVATLSAPEAMEVATETMSERTWADASGAARLARRRMEEGRMVEGGVGCGYRGEIGDVWLVDEQCRKEERWRG
jgi:hypothetical protein